jgi:hypothetical protein
VLYGSAAQSKPASRGFLRRLWMGSECRCWRWLRHSS